MQKKILRLGRKSGPGGNERRRFFLIGVSGLLAVSLSVITGPAQASGTGSPPPPRDHSKPQAKEPLPEKCHQKPDGGPCKALFWNYYFDQKTGECKEFDYGGCEGTVPFETREDCEQECLEARGEPMS